jgi:DNA-binding NarL/FixJ family response regulator
VASVFVGRQSELERLDALVRGTRDARRASAALVRGDPGSGKSRLLEEAMARSGVRQRVRLAGFEPTQAIALASAGELLRQLGRVPIHGARLDELAFGVAEATRDPLRIFEAAHRAAEASGPMVIAVDDLQWVDDVTIGLLVYLLNAATTRTSGLSIITAARPSPVAASFSGAVEAALPPEDRAVLDLGPLSLADGQVLLRALDSRLDATAAADLWRRAAGSPFWLQALALGRGGAGVADVIRERLGAVGGDAASLVAALAIGGRPYQSGQLAEALEWQPERLAAAAHELAARGLAVEAGGALWLAHDLIREAAEREVPTALRRRLHARFGTLLETEAEDDLALLREALEHRAAAGLPSTDLALRLASSPQRRLLGRDGVALLAAISDSLLDGSAEQIDLDERLATTAGSLGEQDVAIERWSRVAANAPTKAQRLRARIEAGWAAFRRRDPVAVHGFVDAARADLGLPHPSGRTASPSGALAGLEALAQDEALEALARVEALEALTALWLDHDTEAGAAAAARALDAARQMAGAGPPDGRRLPASARSAYLAALEAALDAALQQERRDDVGRFGTESLSVASGGDEETRVAALNRFAFALRALDELVHAEPRYRQAWELSSQLVLPAGQVEAGHGVAQCLATMGRLAEAREVAAATADIEARLRHVAQRWGNATAALHEIELSLGDPVGALRGLHEDAADESDPHFRLGIHQTIALWEARWRGRQAARAVEDELAAAKADWELVRCPRCGRELSIRTVEALARIGQAERARGELTRWQATVAGPSRQAEAWRLSAEAALRAAEGNHPAARAILESLVTRLEDTSQLEDALWARIDLGRVLAELDRRAAIEAFEAAAALADRMGARSQARLIARGLRELGVRAWRRGASVAADALSDREAEVARLVAGGSSNREIADALLIAPKTVERHISNALARLGLRNRTELAAAIRAASPTPPGQGRGSEPPSSDR